MKGKLVCGAMLLLTMVLGCLKTPASSEHERKVLELANRHAEQQSLHSRQMAELQKQWQTERTQLNEQRDKLEAERQEIAIQRQREPLIAESIQQVGRACKKSCVSAGKRIAPNHPFLRRLTDGRDTDEEGRRVGEGVCWPGDDSGGTQ